MTPTIEEQLTSKIDLLRKDLKQDVADEITKAVNEWADKQAQKNSQNHSGNPTYAGGTTGGKTYAWSQAKGIENIHEMKALWEAKPTKELVADEDFNRHFGDYCKSVFLREKRQGFNLTEALVKAMGEANGATGGFLVPAEFKPSLLKLIIESQIVRPRATKIPMSTDMAIIPRINDTSHVSTLHGGIKGTWQAENTDISTNANQPDFGQVQLIPKKFDDMVLVGNELIMDSPIAVPPLISVLLREGLGFFEDVDMLLGTGAGKPLGALAAGNGALLSVNRQAAGEISYVDCISMMSKIFPSSIDNAIWVMSPSAWTQIMQLNLPVGTGGSALMVTNVAGQTAGQKPIRTLLGLPYIVSEKMSALGTAKDLAIMDLSYYLVGDRMDMSITTSTDRYFEKDQTAFRIIERLDGQPWINTYLTANNGTDTLSAFCYLN